MPMSISSPRLGVLVWKGSDDANLYPSHPDLPFALMRWSTVYMGCTKMLSTPAAADLLACSRSLQRVAQQTGPHGWRQGCWQEASPWLHLLVSDLSALGGGPPPPVPYLPSGGLAVTIGNAAVTCQPAAASASMFSCVLMLCYTTWDFDIPNGIVVVTVLSLLVLLLLLMMSASRQRESWKCICSVSIDDFLLQGMPSSSSRHLCSTDELAILQNADQHHPASSLILLCLPIVTSGRLVQPTCVTPHEGQLIFCDAAA